MMLDQLGEIESANRPESVISNVIETGSVRIYDMGSSSNTIEMVEEVAIYI